MEISNLLGREKDLFDEDIMRHLKSLESLVAQSKFLVIGAAGSIGQAVSKEIFSRGPSCLHLVDISENNLVELVRDLRSSLGYIKGDFQTFALDVGSDLFERFFLNEGPYDYVLNLSALKHVRSERDPYTLMRMIDVNVFNTVKIADLCISSGVKKYFCVSTDKAANPANLMGATKRIMELFLFEKSESLEVSTARFANVAFSDGSLPHGFQQRLNKRQPLAAPDDIKRYFVTSTESGRLCLLSTLLGKNREIFYPKLNAELHLTRFSDLAVRFLEQRGYQPFFCESEEEARKRVSELASKKNWPVFFFKSDTTGEKPFEEFFTKDSSLDEERFVDIGVIINGFEYSPGQLEGFKETFDEIRNSQKPSKKNLVNLITTALPEFTHKELGKNLDQKM